MAEKVGVKETLELIASLSAFVDVVDEVLEDGKVTFGDVAYLPELISALQPGLEGVGGVAAEAADLDKEEVQKIVTALIEVGYKVVSKLKKVTVTA